MAATASWPLRDLGPFSLRAPPGMQLTRGGSDSLAGTLADASLRLDYDFGPYADPLKNQTDARDFQDRQIVLDGFPARAVRYRLAAESSPLPWCAGVHVPEVSGSGAERIGLTLLACGSDAGSAARAEAIFSTLRFQTRPVR